MHCTTRWIASTAVLLCAWSFPSTARAQQGWSEGEWNEPTFTLKRVCEPRQARESHYYEIAPVGNSYRRVGVLGSQPGDNPAPSAKLELSNGLSAYLTVRADAPASFSARDGAHIGCLAQVTVRVPATFKKPVVVQFSLSALGRGDLDSFEVEVPPATTITQQLRGGVRTVHKNWSAKFGISGPSWSCARIPTGKAVPADQARWHAEALLHSIPFMMGPIAALKSDYSEQFAVSGYVNGERLSADLICIYEGVATKKAASTLRVTPPQPPPAPPPALPSVKVTDDSEQAEEMRRLYQTFQRVREMQQRIEMTAAQLRVQAEAAAQLRARIRLLTEASQDEALTQVAREDAAEAAEKLQKHLHDLLNAQDKLIENIAPDYQELLLQTRNALDKSSNATHTQLTAICKALDQQFALLPLELFLAADRRSQFQNAAWQLSFHKEYQDVANRLRAVDYLRHGEPRAALYALRQSLEHNPNDPTTKQMLLDLEVACLRAFAAKATGDAALAREKFDEALMGKGERGWFNALKDFVTTGPGAFLSVATGKLQAQTNLAVTWQDEAAVTQAGVNLLIRLRHKGYSWQQIQQMKDTEFADALGRLAAATRQDPVKLDDLTTARMRASVRIALQNPDVKRLMAQSKDQFDSDRYNSYFATDSFDLTWIDHAADAVNIANVAGLLPGATIGKAGKVFGAGRQTQAMTLGEGLMSAMKIQQLALAMENSAAGRFALQQLAQFNKQTGIVSKTLAQMILDQGVVEFGRRFGGRPGEIAAEILTTVGATDLDSLLVALEKRGLKAAHIEALGERFLKKGETLAKTRLTPEHYAPQLNKALDALNAPQISAATAQEFRKIADDLAKRPAPRPPTAALGASDDALRLELHKQQILQDAFDAASRGERGKLRAAKDYIQSLEKQIADEAKHLEHVTDSATKVSKKLKEKPANPPLVQHTGAGETASNVGGGSRAPAPSSTPGGGTTGGAKKPTTTKLGNDALVDARMTENLGPLAQQADEAFFRQQYQEARIRYSLLLDRDDIPAKTRQDLQQRLKLIEQLQTTRNEQQDAELVMRLGGKANQHTRDFDPRGWWRTAEKFSPPVSKANYWRRNSVR
jgi:hypothetical protein